MDNTIEVQISYHDKEIRKSLIYVFNRIYRYWITLSCFLTVTVAFCFYGIINGLSNYNKGLVAVFALCTLLYYLLYYHIPISKYIDFYRTRKGGTYTFTNEDIKIVGAEAQSICAWSIFKKAIEIPNAFLLTDDNRFFYILPKRCFMNTEDISHLQELLSRKIVDFKRY